MGDAAVGQAKYTETEYLSLERASKIKSEFINDRIFAMAGATRAHNQITFNIAVALGSQLRGRPCFAFVNDMRVKVSETGLYTYPDVVATCDKLKFIDTHADTLLNPALIIEVLSDSTEAYDRGEKFAHYRRLPSLREYVLVSQNTIRIEYYLRQERRWILTEFNTPEEELPLSAINCGLSLRDIYEKVTFPEKT